jgi:hypothetical protein
MRKALGIGIGVTALATLALGGVTVAAAAGPAGDSRPVAVSATSKVDRAQARRLAEAAVPGGRVVQVESDDAADRPVWKATVDGPGGRVSVWIDAMTGVVSVGNRPDGSAAMPGVGGPDDGAAAPSSGPDDATRGGDDHGRPSGSDDRSSGGEDRRDGSGRDDGSRDDRNGDDQGRGGSGRGGHDDGPGHR